MSSKHPIVGIHTRLTDEVEPWKIQKSLKLVRELGATAIVEFFPWSYYEPSPGVYDWRHSDLVIEHAYAQGLQIIARMGTVPAWARPEGTPLNFLRPESYPAFASFVAAFAERYRDRVSAVIVGNEPNLSFEWGFLETGPVDYVNLLREVYPEVKEVDEDMRILAGALAPTLEPPGSPWGLDDLLYLKEMYLAGAQPYFDALAVHSYGMSFPPQAKPDPEVINFRRVELLRNIMVKFGDADKTIAITEAGWNDHPRFTHAVRPAQRIQYTLEAVEYAEENWEYVEKVVFWAFRFPASVGNYRDYYSFVTPEFVVKPIYLALKEFNQ